MNSDTPECIFLRFWLKWILSALFWTSWLPFSMSWSNSALGLLWVNCSIIKTIIYLLWHEKIVHREQFKMILVSQFPERQLLEYKKISECIKVCFLKKYIFFNVRDLFYFIWFAYLSTFFFSDHNSIRNWVPSAVRYWLHHIGLVQRYQKCNWQIGMYLFWLLPLLIRM